MENGKQTLRGKSQEMEQKSPPRIALFAHCHSAKTGEVLVPTPPANSNLSSPAPLPAHITGGLRKEERERERGHLFCERKEILLHNLPQTPDLQDEVEPLKEDPPPN
ncbi:hypothetical protein CEXT_159461 [Caerostris extrusa]|uniref:Uncharacterized protein n=1 Tax=Caerostris extrusa TaxID=172846 RepID=A0AAV4T0T0_CAEEX|nr:hypothetical protein CEXT_159461 [Caerostris extrusa]